MLAIVQARSSSLRLPRKVLMPINGIPLIGWTIQRLRQSQLISKIVLATSNLTTDDNLASYVHELNIDVYRGALDDVVTRFINVVKVFQPDAFVRVCGDSPLIDPRLIDYGISLYKGRDCDIVTNVFPRTFPKGQSVEVISSKTFANAWIGNSVNCSREHITEIFYQNPSSFRIINFSNSCDLSHVQLSVDTLDDFNRISEIIRLANFTPKGWEELVEISEFCLRNATSA